VLKIAMVEKNMTTIESLTHLSDDQLVARVQMLIGDERRHSPGSRDSSGRRGALYLGRPRCLAKPAIDEERCAVRQDEERGACASPHGFS
jgi:hypothetical protein